MERTTRGLEASEAAFSADGKIVVVGRALPIDATGSADAQAGAFAIVRFNPDGSLDATFGAEPAQRTYVQGGAPVVLLRDAGVADPDVMDTTTVPGGAFGGSRLLVGRRGGPVAGDVFSATGNLLLDGGVARLAGATLGTAVQSAGLLSIDFGAAASGEQIAAVLNSIAYANVAAGPSRQVEIEFRFFDGAGADALFASDVVTVDVQTQYQPLSGLDLRGTQVAENAVAGAVIGSLSATGGDGASYVFSEVDDPEGKFTVIGDQLRLASALDFETVASHRVTLKVEDGAGGRFERTFAIDVVDVNEAPLPQRDVGTAAEDGPSVTLSVLTNDRDPDAGDPIRLLSVDGTGIEGTVALAADGSAIVYSPGSGLQYLAAGATRTERFGYTVEDAGGLRADAVVEITVTGVNDAPVARDEQYATDEDTRIEPGTRYGVLHRAVDVDRGDRLVAALVSGPSHGVLTLASDGDFVYLPDRDFNGTDGFMYRVEDEHGAWSVARAEIVVLPVNDPPFVRTKPPDVIVSVVSGGSIEVPFDPATVFGEIDAGDDLSYASELPSWLTLEGRKARGTPPASGDYQLTMIARDQEGATASAGFTLRVNVNHAPRAADDFTSIQEDGPTDTVRGNVLANDSDEDGERLEFGAWNDVDTPVRGAYGWLTWAADGSYEYRLDNDRDVVQALNADDTVIDVFTYRVGDPRGATARAELRVQVLGADDGGSVFVGTPGSDVWTGGSLADTVSGNDGDDVLDGAGGDDTLQGGPGGDRLTGSAGNDVLLSNADYVQTIAGGSGGRNPRTLERFVGSTVVNRSYDAFDGGPGYDIVRGTDGNDGLLLDSQFSSVASIRSGPRFVGVERIEGGAGDDFLSVLTTRWEYGAVTLDGGTGQDILWASTGNDVLLGGAGNDLLFGDAGQDTLYGGPGEDTLQGWNGADVYLFGRGDGADTLKWLGSAPREDVLRLGEGIGSDQVWFRRMGDDLQIAIVGTTDVVQVAGWYLSDNNKLAAIATADGRTIDTYGIAALVQAMAAFAPPPPGQTSLSDSLEQALGSSIQAQWSPSVTQVHIAPPGSLRWESVSN